jgi:rhodanese-related sulfurtransferase
MRERINNMLPKHLLHTLTEIVLIVALSATAGMIWNRTLLVKAWRGEATLQSQQAKGVAAAAPAAEVAPMPIMLQQVKELYDAKQCVIVDARNSASFAKGHISGAVALPLEKAQDPAAIASTVKAPKDAMLIAYCNGFSCHDSMELGKLLIRAGYTSVYVYEGGFPEWRDSGYPVATGGV